MYLLIPATITRKQWLTTKSKTKLKIKSTVQKNGNIFMFVKWRNNV